MRQYPKFEQRIKEQIVHPARSQTTSNNYGIVMDYDPMQNTCTLLMSRPGSDQRGEFVHDVPCITQMGIQTVAPEPGRGAWVSYKDGVDSNPLIVGFFNYSYTEFDYTRQTVAENDTPRFMMEM